MVEVVLTDPEPNKGGTTLVEWVSWGQTGNSRRF